MEKAKLLFHTYKGIAKDLSLYLTANLVQVFIGILMNPVLASHLSATDFAVIGYYDSFNLFIIPLLSFSLSSYYAKNYFNWTEQERENALNSLLVFQAVAGIASVVILLTLLKIYFVILDINFSFFPFAFLSFGVLLLQSFFSFYLQNLRLKKKPLKYFRTSLVYTLINVVLTIFFVVHLNTGAAGRMGSLFLGALVLGTYSLSKGISGLKADMRVVRNALRFCWPLMLSALLTYFFSGFEKLLLERTGDVTNFGLYSIATKIISYFIIFSMSIDAAFEADYYKAISGRNFMKLKKVVLSTLFVKILPAAVFLTIAGFVTGILTNFRYTDAAGFARILAVGSIMQSISFTFSMLLVSLGFPRLALLEKIVGAILIIFIDIILINHYGFDGAAWGQVLGYAIMSVISLGILFYLYKKRLIFISTGNNTPLNGGGYPRK